jgi:hypothetical protein
MADFQLPFICSYKLPPLSNKQIGLMDIVLNCREREIPSMTLWNTNDSTANNLPPIQRSVGRESWATKRNAMHLSLALNHKKHGDSICLLMLHYEVQSENSGLL